MVVALLDVADALFEVVEAVNGFSDLLLGGSYGRARADRHCGTTITARLARVVRATCGAAWVSFRRGKQCRRSKKALHSKKNSFPNKFRGD